MERSKAQEIIKGWAAQLEVDTDREFFADVIEELSLPVMKGRLDFDSEKEVFRYQLLKPIEKQDGSGCIEVVEIRETDMNENKDVQRFKDNEKIDQATVLLARSCGLEMGFASRLKQRDVHRINAVILGFFAQAG